MPVSRFYNTRTTIEGGNGGTGSEPTIILDGENIVSQSPGFDTTATTGGIGNYNVGTSETDVAADDNWIEGFDNIIDGDNNNIQGNFNVLTTTDFSQIKGSYNQVTNGDGSTIFGNGNQVDNYGVSIIGSGQKTFASTTHYLGEGLSAIPSRSDLTDPGEIDFLFRNGNRACFLSNLIDLNSLSGVITWNFPSGSNFGLLALSWQQSDNNNDGSTAATIVVQSDGNTLINTTINRTLPGKSIQIFSLVNSFRSNNLTLEITIATDNTSQTGRFLFEGILTDF